MRDAATLARHGGGRDESYATDCIGEEDPAAKGVARRGRSRGRQRVDATRGRVGCCSSNCRRDYQIRPNLRSDRTAFDAAKSHFQLSKSAEGGMVLILMVI